MGEVVLDRFPVHESGKPTFRDDFGAPRSGGRHHDGTDIFAPKGTPVLAVRAGKARNQVESKGGRVVYLTAPDGARYYYAHLDNWKRIAEPGQLYDVRSGDVLGFVGDTGNAKGLPPHLHFQVAEKDGLPLNPFPFLEGVATAAVRVNPEPAPGAGTVPPVQRRSSSSAAGFGGLGGIGWLVVLYLAFGRKRR